MSCEWPGVDNIECDTRAQPEAMLEDQPWVAYSYSCKAHS